MSLASPFFVIAILGAMSGCKRPAQNDVPDAAVRLPLTPAAWAGEYACNIPGEPQFLTINEDGTYAQKIVRGGQIVVFNRGDWSRILGGAPGLILVLLRYQPALPANVRGAGQVGACGVEIKNEGNKQVIVLPWQGDFACSRDIRAAEH